MNFRWDIEIFIIFGQILKGWYRNISIASTNTTAEVVVVDSPIVTIVINNSYYIHSNMEKYLISFNEAVISTRPSPF